MPTLKNGTNISVHKTIRFIGYGVTANPTEVPLPRANIGRPFFLGPAPGCVLVRCTRNRDWRVMGYHLVYVLMCLLHAIVVVKGISITLMRMHRIRGTMCLRICFS